MGDYEAACVEAVEANAVFLESAAGEDYAEKRKAAHDAMRAALKLRPSGEPSPRRPFENKGPTT